jgi:hypothetical protein
MRKTGPELRRTILEIVENQLNDGDPPQTRQPLDRLMAGGMAEADAKTCIAGAVCVEIRDVLRNQKPFDRECHLRNPAELPKEPSD